MRDFIVSKLDAFEKGKISKRQFVEMLALAATVPASGAHAAEPDVKLALVNHLSYACADVERTAEWYSRLFNLEPAGTSTTNVVLPFAKQGEQPYNVADKDVPATYLLIGGWPATGPKSDSRPRALINHVAYTIADFDQARVRAELKTLGYANPLRDGEQSFHIVDPNGFDVQISGIAMTALGG